jgi:release factor glutamine methyltransferase
MSLTIADALAAAARQLGGSSGTPRLDAELLLAHALGWSRARLLAEGRSALPDAERDAFGVLVARRANLEPVAYIVRRREFFGLDFYVDERVLVPRPETELLVELALDFARRRTAAGCLPPHGEGNVSSSPLVIADIGTGSGCIAVSLAVHLPHASILATDISADALEVARVNAERHQVAGRVRLLRGDLVAPLPEPVDLLLSNPPYTVLAEIDEGVRRHEPRLALDGGSDGLALYRRLLGEAPYRLRAGGALLLEIGATQGPQVAELARAAFPGAEVRVHADLAGLDRVVAVEMRPDITNTEKERGP